MNHPPVWIEEAPWSFKEELRKPIRPLIGLSAPQQAMPPGHVRIDSNFSLVIAGTGGGPALDMAVADLQRFFAEAGVSLACCPEDEASSSRIRLCVDQQEVNLGKKQQPKQNAKLAADLDETYTIRVSPNAVDILSSSPRGVLKGVYALQEMCAASGGPWLPLGEVQRTPFLKTRILRSYWSPYYTDELAEEEDFYPDAYLETLSRLGVNGVWIHGYLQELVPTTIFPEFGQRAQQRLAKLNNLISRAACYGIDVFIYFCEPKALAADDPFWEAHPEVKGSSAKGNSMDVASWINCLCTSAPETQRYLAEVYQGLFELAPGLGGVILITASENHSHCYSHGTSIDCPRCKKRQPTEVLCEMLQIIASSVHRASPAAKVVVWTWSWGNLAPDPQVELLAKLSGVEVMSDFERDGSFELEGETYPINEYSMKYTGPSPRFIAQAKAAQNAQLGIFAKMQICSTHELAIVPYFPAPWRMAEKWRGLREQGVEGVMGCWIFGNYPSVMLEVVRELTWEPHPPVDEVIDGIARRIFDAGSSQAATAWLKFGEALNDYPFSNTLLYYSPVNRAPSLPWSLPGRQQAMTASHLVLEPGDTIDDWTRPFGPELALHCFQRVLSKWTAGLALLHQAVQVSANHHPAQLHAPTPAERELIVARAFAHHMQSTVNFLRFGINRDAYEAAVQSGSAPHTVSLLLRTISAIVADEIVNRRAYLPLVRADARLGYHSEAEGYFYTADTLTEAIVQLEQLADRVKPPEMVLGGP